MPCRCRRRETKWASMRPPGAQVWMGAIIDRKMMTVIQKVFGRSRMKVSREQAQQNREKVVQSAARLFRERGIDGVGVAELMNSVGLTHGGFYGQFGSKEELVAEACAWAFERSAAKWKRTA